MNMKKLTWFVFINNFNAKNIEHYNVFKHSSFAADVEQMLKVSHTKDEFSERLKRIAQYYFWSKCEMEVVVSSWPVYITVDEYNRITDELNQYKEKYHNTPRVLNISPHVSSKVDIYEQLLLNWDIFVDYIWDRR
jgi:hypothetical protein